MNHDIPLPVNSSVMNDWCSPFKTLSRRVSKFSKCMPPFLAQVVVVLGSGIKKPVKYICKANKAKAIENYACMTTKYLERFNRRESFFLDSLQIISKNVTDDQILPHFCCAVNTLLHDIYALERPRCKDSSINTNNFIGDMVSLAVSDVLDLMCGSFRSHKACQEKAPQALKFWQTKELIPLI
ncbi:uncharacterized protein LOC128392794 isoform X2 [Panonychus citri]|nr:uncharacterized protein LOC128392794 isoform X2 [Panonychus citri]